MTKEELKFYIRHHNDFLQDKMVLVFKSDAAKEYFESRLEGVTFEEVTSEMAHHAVRVGIAGKTLPFGYTYKLTKEEIQQLDTANWQRTAELLAEGNERLYLAAKEKKETD